MALYVGVGYVLLGLQLTLNHAKAGWHHAAMRVPVLVTPLLVLAAFAHAFFRADAIFTGAFALGLVTGIIGSILHTRGVMKRPGGLLKVRNLMDGPPFLLSSVYWTLSAFALLIHFWPRIAG